MRCRCLLLVALIVGMTSQCGAQTPSSNAGKSLPYCVVGTGQNRIFSDKGQLLTVPKPGEPFFGQDAFHPGPAPSYRDNGNGTVTDLNTSLTWVRARGAKVTSKAAAAGAASCGVGGFSDWRMPTIKELYSLINFNGGYHPEGNSVPYLDTKFFDFKYGDESQGERGIDCQDWSATSYVSTTMDGNPTEFGVNFADGRIKGYPKLHGRRDGQSEHRMYVRYVRGNPAYGKNDFHDNHDGTITDRATGLMWARADSGQGMNWQAALAWAQARNADKYLGHSDWRLPNAKELQSIVDYTRAPTATHSPAIDPLFQTTALADGEYPYSWSSTTHLDGPSDRLGLAAIYVSFGRALGWMQFPPGWGEYRLLDVHGAGAQRSDPKSGDASDFPRGRGPQGDVIRIDNFVRLVRYVDPASARQAQIDLTPLPVSPSHGRRPMGPEMGPPPGGFPPGPGFPPGARRRPGFRPGMKPPPGVDGPDQQ